MNIIVNYETDRTNYPYALCIDTDRKLSLREDEVKTEVISNKLFVEIGDAFERECWKLSEGELFAAIEALKGDSVLNEIIKGNMIGKIKRVLVQREFMRDNYSLRNSLLP